MISTPSDRSRRLAAALLWFGILALGAVLRLPALRSGWPYFSYVDEGHVVQTVVGLLERNGWDPQWYGYPSLPIYVIAGLGRALGPIYAWTHGHPLQVDLIRMPGGYYDLAEPAALLMVARLATLAFALGIIVLAGLLARRGAGQAAGYYAAFLAAVLPALVIRSSIVIVDTYATFFVLLALLSVSYVTDAKHRGWFAVLAGVASGLALSSKYNASLVLLAVITTILLSRTTWRGRLTSAALAVSAAAIGAVLSMPALILRTTQVLASIERQSKHYALDAIGSFWKQAIFRAEWDQPLEHPEVGLVFVVLAFAGLVLAVADKRTMRLAWGWTIFIAGTLAIVLQYQFQPFRNLLPVAALGCVLVALLLAWARERLRRPRLFDLAAVVVVTILYAPPLTEYARNRLTVVDSRVQAIEQLARTDLRGGAIVVLQELAIAPSQLRRLEGPIVVAPWSEAQALIAQGRPEILVLGDIQQAPNVPTIDKQAWAAIEDQYELRYKFGETPTPHVPGRWRSNSQRLYVLMRRH